MSDEPEQVKSAAEISESILREVLKQVETALAPIDQAMRDIHPHDQDEWEHDAPVFTVGNIRRMAQVLAAIREVK